MSLLILLQIGFNLVFVAIGTLFLLERTKYRSQDNPQLSRGLQLLSSKIAILQDLMDRTETLSRQVSQLLDQKQQGVQEKIEEIEIYLQKVHRAIEKSQEVAKIFQDKIPHQEIIERQNTLKYLQAAKLAHQGFSTGDISKQVDLPLGELELITKINKDRLVVEKEPLWVETAPTVEPLLPSAPLPANKELIAAVSGKGSKFRQKLAEIKPVVFKKITTPEIY